MAPEDSETIAPWRALLEAHSAVVDLLAREMEEQTSLPLGWYEVLLYLQESPQGRLRMHEIAESLLISRSAVTRFVDRMEQAGLVERVTCAADKRGLELVMTAAGRAAFKTAGRIHLRGIREHFASHISPAESEVIRRAMARVAAAAREARAGHDAA
jgi:DNA-binding MarR family transcriptional regulator